MSIQKHLEWVGYKFIGHTDIGNCTEDDNSPLVSEAFVSVSFETSLLKLSDVGVKTVSLTCDGPHCNQAMLKILGAKLDVKI